jgi:hypothetical protein
MNRRTFLISTLAIASQFSVIFPAVGSEKEFEPSLAKLAAEGKGWKVENRTVSPIFGGSSANGVRFEERAGVGIAWIEDYEFANGVIEFDVRGKNVPQHSFVGVAFHRADGETYDAVYFRPFNFKSEDPERRGHAVQYISQPAFTWQKLRSEHPGAYEQPLQPPPDPDAWSHVRIVVNSPKVSVFVNHAKEPSLSVEQLSSRRKGRIGIWVGDGSGGDFGNLRITSVR